ncbi:MAG: hypothetical protein EB072_19715, partial [Betaproteobacteria bacterium]|nr:hypothetical protein [Betaproteobacteria bacterium]
TKKVVQNNFVETAQKGIKLSGYVDAGYSYNFTGASAGTSDVTGRFGSDTAAKGDFNLYAVKLALEKALTSENKAQAGFRADVMIGEDAGYLANRNTQANLNNSGQNSNYLFLEQAYVSIRAPVGNGWDFKVGKFVSPLGYEVIERPANMNTTYGLIFQQLPLYYTGVLSSYKFDDYLAGKLGVVNGSNTDNNTTTSGNKDGCAVLASLDVTAPGGNATWSNNFQWSVNNENNTSWDQSSNSIPVITLNSASSGNSYTFIYNSWGNWAPKFADDKLLFAFNAMLLTSGGDGTATITYPGVGADFAVNDNYTSYGVGAYAKYQFNDWFYLGGRGETLGIASNGYSTNLWEWTLTAGFNVIDNLLIRAEYRLDWGNDSVNNAYTNNGNLRSPVGNLNTSSGPAHYAGAEVVYSF